ncbi:Acid phosphatase, partial [Colletotrichum tanaceti]
CSDDGWAELYLRSFYDALRASGHKVIISATAESQPGSGKLDIEPKDRDDPCQYGSCPAFSGPTGFNATCPDLYWVNSVAVTTMRYGIDRFATERWNATPELAVSGVNVGSTFLSNIPVSGNVAAAAFASGVKSIPAIAFSGASNGNLP